MAIDFSAYRAPARTTAAIPQVRAGGAFAASRRVESYDHALPLGGLLQDALALPLFGGGNVGVRRRQLHAILKQPEYDPLMISGEAEV